MIDYTGQRIAMGLILVMLMLTIGLTFFRSYTGLSRGKSWLTLLATCLAGGISFYIRSESLRESWRSGDRHAGFSALEWTVLFAAMGGASFLFLTALLIRLWGRWIGDQATPAEMQPGKLGIRAWFSWANVAMGIAIMLTTWLGFDISPLVSGVAIAALLAASPVLQPEISTNSRVTPSNPMNDDLSAEREKILALLEAGKVNAEECAELLQALGSSGQRPAAAKIPLSGSQRLMLIGAGLVLLGFFLPWLVINPGKELSREMGEMPGLNMMPGVRDFSENAMPMFKTGTISMSGGEVGKGLGWATLLLALTAAALPYVNASLDGATVRIVRLLCLSIGGIIVLYLLTSGIRFVSIGLILAFCGYVLEFFGVLRPSAGVLPAGIQRNPVRP